MRRSFNRMVSLFVAVCLMISCVVFCVGASAAAGLAVTVESKNVTAGETVDVDISITSNPGITVLRLKVDYDTSVLTLVGFTDAGVLSNDMSGSNYASPYTLYWNGNLLKDNITATGVIGTLQFKVNDAAAIGTTANVSVSAGKNDVLNANLSSVALSATNATLTVYDRLASIMPAEKVKNPMGSIRLESTDPEYVSAGLRFRGTLTAEQYADATEIGFVAAPYNAISSDSNWYKLDANGAVSSSIVKKAVCFDSAKGTNIVYSTDGTDKSYQLIITGLSIENGAKYYNLEIAAVMYVKSAAGYKYYRIDSTTYQNIYDYCVANGIL